MHCAVVEIVDHARLFEHDEVIFHLDARGARLAGDALAALKEAWPETAWGKAGGDEVVDLRAGARRKAWVALGVFAVGAGAVAIVNPPVAMALGVVGLGIGARVYSSIKRMQRGD